MDDRFTRGFLAGFLAALVQAFINLTAHYLNLTKVSWFTFAGVLLFGHRPATTGEHIFSWLVAMGFSGAMGVLFAYLLPYWTSQNYLFKGMFFGSAVWFAAFAMTVLFKVPGLEEIQLSSSLVNFFGSLIWGLLTAELLGRFGLAASVED